jgi:hypothetical protein
MVSVPPLAIQFSEAGLAFPCPDVCVGDTSGVSGGVAGGAEQQASGTTKKQVIQKLAWSFMLLSLQMTFD